VRSLLLVLVDLHAADDPSLLLLQFLARQLRGARTHSQPGCSCSLDGISDLRGGARPEAEVAAVDETAEGDPLFVREAVLGREHPTARWNGSDRERRAVARLRLVEVAQGDL
jgi:hypothetical protein